MSTGWIKLYRKIEDWPLYFAEPFTKAQAWIDLLILAQYHPSIISVRGNLIEVKRGEIAWSEDALACRWFWSRNKVRRFLIWLKTAQQIELQKSSILSKIIILKYEEYQQNDTTDDTTERQQTIQQTDTYKESKKEKKVKNTPDHFSNDPLWISFQEFWNFYPRKIAKEKAFLAWKRVNVSSDLSSKILSHVSSMRKDPRWLKDDGQFIPHPTTYLNQARWDEVIEKLQETRKVNVFSAEDYEERERERLRDLEN